MEQLTPHTTLFEGMQMWWEDLPSHPGSADAPCRPAVLYSDKGLELRLLRSEAVWSIMLGNQLHE